MKLLLKHGTYIGTYIKSLTINQFLYERVLSIQVHTYTTHSEPHTKNVYNYHLLLESHF